MYPVLFVLLLLPLILSLILFNSFTDQDPVLEIFVSATFAPFVAVEVNVVDEPFAVVPLYNCIVEFETRLFLEILAEQDTEFIVASSGILDILKV